MAERLDQLALQIADRAAESLIDSESLNTWEYATDDAQDISGRYWSDTSAIDAERYPTVAADMKDALEYLELRRLLRRHPTKPGWVHVAGSEVNRG